MGSWSSLWTRWVPWWCKGDIEHEMDRLYVWYGLPQLLQ
jgi:hypothetical protein